MPYVLSWFVVLALLALWSLTAWALQAVAVWTVTNAGSLGNIAAATGAVRLPDGLASWVPPEVAQSLGDLLAGLAPVVQALLQTVPALAGGVTVLAWIVWSLGSLMLIGLGVAGHVAILAWRRRSASSLPLPRPDRAIHPA